jgi:hypothetical protein
VRFLLSVLCSCSDVLLVCGLGISFKTQALYALVFVTRYVDLLFRWISLYNFVMKLFFISSSCYILYLMKYRYRFVLTRMHVFHECLPRF